MTLIPSRLILTMILFLTVVKPLMQISDEYLDLILEVILPVQQLVLAIWPPHVELQFLVLDVEDLRLKEEPWNMLVSDVHVVLLG